MTKKEREEISKWLFRMAEILLQIEQIVLGFEKEYPHEEHPTIKLLKAQHLEISEMVGVQTFKGFSSNNSKDNKEKNT